MHVDPHEMARNLARTLLGNATTVSRTQIERAVDGAQEMILNQYGLSVDRERVVDGLEEIYRVWTGEGRLLVSAEGHQPWLDSRRSTVDWLLWRRYERFLVEKRDYAPAVVTSLNRLTDEILGQLEDPQRSEGWDRRGMVVGHVQSGKTGNYIGLINKAIDAGYRLVIVLAGRHNSLRSQTQQRIDEGVLGYDTQVERPGESAQHAMGVGTVSLPGRDILTLTSSHENGDFTQAVARRRVARLGATPIVLVVKKVQSILKSVYRWCRTQGQVGPRDLVRGIPVLIIDDEADDASINTRAVPRGGEQVAEDDPTAINASIRKLLGLFEQRAFVSYTATPYANIYIDRDASSASHGDDLFPRSFILTLPAPSTYTGPERVFGVNSDPAEDGAETALVNMVRVVRDWATWIPEGHDRTWRPGKLPDSMLRAMRVFILTCAARRVRGQITAHNSMLVHVTRFTAVQSAVSRQIRDELEYLQGQLEHEASGNAALYGELEVLWGLEFAPGLADELDWERVKQNLRPAALKIRISEFNGTARDALAYYEQRHQGLSVIAVGGDKLSRGLTLEGLSVSYYLRASRMYDTLMQMGRWFGYRPGYLDLCRLYTTSDLIGWYAHIASADAELRMELEEMALRNRTPQDYGLRVRSHPAMTVTATNKMRNGTRVELSYAGDISETVVFHRDPGRVHANRLAVERLVAGQGEATLHGDSQMLWSRVSPDSVLELLDDYQVHEDSRRMRPKLLSQYIRSRVNAGCLIEWTVALISRGEANREMVVGNHRIGMIERTVLPGETDSRLSIRRLLSPADEQADLDERTRQRALDETRLLRPDAVRPGGRQVRAGRSPRRGLLLLYPLLLRRDADPGRGLAAIDLETWGLAVSFPDDPDAPGVEYVVNSVYWEDELGEG